METGISRGASTTTASRHTALIRGPSWIYLAVYEFGFPSPLHNFPAAAHHTLPEAPPSSFMPELGPPSLSMSRRSRVQKLTQPRGLSVMVSRVTSKIISPSSPFLIFHQMLYPGYQMHLVPALSLPLPRLGLLISSMNDGKFMVSKGSGRPQSFTPVWASWDLSSELNLNLEKVR